MSHYPDFSYKAEERHVMHDQQPLGTNIYCHLLVPMLTRYASTALISQTWWKCVVVYCLKSPDSKHHFLTFFESKEYLYVFLSLFKLLQSVLTVLYWVSLMKAAARFLIAAILWNFVYWCIVVVILITVISNSTKLAR